MIRVPRAFVSATVAPQQRPQVWAKRRPRPALQAAFLEKAQRDVAFFVGGADGFSQSFRQEADLLLSLSKMTLPHELARVVLAEQIYRAFTILRNHPYPR